MGGTPSHYKNGGSLYKEMMESTTSNIRRRDYLYWTYKSGREEVDGDGRNSDWGSGDFVTQVPIMGHPVEESLWYYGVPIS